MEKYSGEIRIIAGKWRGRLLPVCDHEGLRPTPNRVRETLFNWLQSPIVGAQCLDLFAGTGALGFEALSRGALHVTFVESHLPLLHQLRLVAEKLDTVDSCTFKHQDALQFIRSNVLEPLDIIFLDPPFASPLLDQCINMLGQSPLVADHTLIYVESSAPLLEENLPSAWRLLKQQKAGAVFYHLIKGGE